MQDQNINPNIQKYYFNRNIQTDNIINSSAYNDNKNYKRNIPINPNNQVYYIKRTNKENDNLNKYQYYVQKYQTKPPENKNNKSYRNKTLPLNENKNTKLKQSQSSSHIKNSTNSYNYNIRNYKCNRSFESFENLFTLVIYCIIYCIP